MVIGVTVESRDKPTLLEEVYSRWGLTKRGLPDPYRSRFKEFVEVLHVKYFYNGDCPKGRPRKEFSKWLRRVREYINDINDIESEIAEKKREDS